ncbi:MAG: ABC transporter ATP-binding protein [Prolixibacteraceae bacterium]|nr:ABC transporter ATP-binding protein [Prolixibacteraceae bacterium]
MSTIIKVENLGKSYLIGHQRERYVALRDVLANKARQVASKTKNILSGGQLIAGNEIEEFWALKDINFEVNQGDRVGIIGRNGAGKSTLLKVLSRITEPTTGRIQLKGRVASLLEVGTGFHPELSGRENIYLNGAILGMSQIEVRKKFDEIVDFAGVEKFLDTPVKRYSSGMYVRLAFAVAAHLEPEILIIDEVLAVGDAEFQKKCLGKMEDVSKNEGRTVLFVSHDMANISSLTNNAICLVNGEIAFQGNTRDTINYYLQNGLNICSIFKAEPDLNKPNFTYAAVKTSESDGVHFNGEDLEIEVEVNMPKIIEGMSVSFQIFNSRRFPVIYGYLFDVDQPILRETGRHKFKCILPKCKLYQDTYYVKLHLAESKGREKFQEIDNICEFEVKMIGKIIEWGWQKDVCIYTEDFSWELY